VLAEFYAGIRHVGVSALTGEGAGAFFDAATACAADYARDYLPELEARRAAREGEEARRREKEMARLRADMAAVGVSGGSGGSGGRGGGSGAAAAAGAAAAGAAAAAGGGDGNEDEDEGESCDYEVSGDSIEPSETGGDGDAAEE
jgi:hypothetical protein